MSKAACRCGTARVLVRSGSVVRVGLIGAFPVSASFGPDLLEPASGRCAGCGSEDRPGVAAAVRAARSRRPAPYGVAAAGPGSRFEPLPMDEPLCSCGSASASLIVHGDHFAEVDGTTVAGELYRSAADPAEGARWECAARPFGGCPRPYRSILDVREAAATHARQYLGRLPDVTAGAPLPHGAADGWPARAHRVRGGPPAFDPPVSGMTFDDAAWLERPRHVSRAAEYVAAGFRPEQLLAVYPGHQVAWRAGGERPACGGDFARTWFGAGVSPARAALWLAAGVWPCCARRFAAAGLGSDEAVAWQAAGFGHPDEASAWAEGGFGPEEARAWADAGAAGPDTARGCGEAGLAPGTVLAWAWLWQGRTTRSRRGWRGPQPEPHHLEQLVAWRAAGLDGDQARRWAEAGFTPAEARGWPPCHPQRPDDVVLAAMAALRK